MIWHQPTNSRGNYNYNSFFYTDCEWRHHFHKNFELIYVSEGELEVQVDGRTQIVTPGEFVLVLPNRLHFLHTPKSSKSWVGVFSEDYVSEFAKLVAGKENVNMKFRCTDEEMQYLHANLICGEKKPLLCRKAALYMVCARFLATTELVKADTDRSLAHKIIEYTENNFRRDMTLREIADSLGYEYHYFSRFFKNIFKINFKTFLNQYRFEYAKQLILKTDMNMTEVALESGFGSVRNFNRIYKEIANVTPKDDKPPA